MARTNLAQVFFWADFSYPTIQSPAVTTNQNVPFSVSAIQADFVRWPALLTPINPLTAPAKAQAQAIQYAATIKTIFTRSTDKVANGWSEVDWMNSQKNPNATDDRTTSPKNSHETTDHQEVISTGGFGSSADGA
jgi:hypothetical protein